MVKVLALAIAGALGTIARYWVSGLAQRSVKETFPAGTLLVNVGLNVIVGIAAVWMGVAAGRALGT